MPVLPAPLPVFFAAPEALLRDVLAISLTAINLLRPLYGPGGELTDFALEYLNPAAQRITELPEQPGTTARAHFPDIVANGVFAMYCRVFETGNDERFDFNYQADGFDNYFNIAARRSGELLVVSFTDTADQPRTPMEEELRARGAHHQAASREAQARQGELEVLFEQVPLALALLRGPRHVLEVANTRMAQIWGRPLAGLLGRPHFEVLPDLAGQGFEEVFDGVFQNGLPHHFQEQLVATAQDQQPCQGYFNISYQPAYDGQGHIQGIIAAAVEVTDQVLARRKVQALNEELEARVQERTQQVQAARAEAEVQRTQLQRLFMQAPAGICILTGPDLVYEFVNPGYQQLVPGRALLGHPVLEVVPELAAAGVEALLRQVYETGETHEGQDVLVPVARPPDGVLEERYFTFVYQARRDEQQRVDGVISFVFEVTEQVHARQATEASAQQALALADELYVANERLVRTNVDLDTFIYTASHDLKAPIANIEGLLQLLRQQLPAEVRQAALVPKVLGMMQGAVERFQLTIAQLTDLAKLQHAHTQPAEEVDLSAVIADVRLDLAPRLEEAKGQLLVHLEGCATVSFAPQHLRSLLYNLLSNAIKYRHPDRPPVVQLRGYHTAATTVLEVQDNGLGLNAKQQSKLFGMFRRLHDHVPGSGVGLYMVKRIVENAGGVVAVQSEAGVGSTFIVALPA